MVHCQHSRDLSVLFNNFTEDIIDFDLEKHTEDPTNKHTWVYSAQYRGWTFQRVLGPKGISK
jgi:hypothetical protein